MLKKSQNLGIRAIVFLGLMFLTNVAYSQVDVPDYRYFAKQFSVTSSLPLELTDNSAASLNIEFIYQVHLVTRGTGTKTGAEYLVWYDSGNLVWKTRAVSLNGTNGNHPLLIVDNNIVKVSTNHASPYPIKAFVKELQTYEADVVPHFYGSSFQWQRSTDDLFYVDGKVGIGTTTPTEKLEIYNSPTAPGVISLKSSRNDASNVDVGRISIKQNSTEVARIGFPRSGGTYTGYLTFWTKDDNGELTPSVERMRIDALGNVGIGTTTPTVKLEIAKDNGANTVDLLKLVNANSTYSQSVNFSLNTSKDLVFNGASSAGGIEFNMGSNGYRFLNGNVGIGTTTPEANLQIGHSTQNGMVLLGGGKGASGIGSTHSDGGLILGKNIYARYDDVSDNKIGRVALTSTYGFSGIKLTHNGEIDFFGAKGNVTADDVANSDQNIKMKIDTDGNVGIGTTDPGNYKLAVEGKIGARSFKVTTASWADYVFTPSYQLMPLTEVENYIQQNQHLPNVPSAQEVEENGFELEEMDAKLMEKIEELTLYMIDQEKRLQQQNEEIQQLKKELKKG